jgi:hypothetical protein
MRVPLATLLMSMLREDVAFGDRPPHHPSFRQRRGWRWRRVSEGVIAADGKAAELLPDEELMRAHRPELPFGFDPRSVTLGA